MKQFLHYWLLVAATAMASTLPAQPMDSLANWTIGHCFQYATSHNILVTTLQLSQASAEQDVIAAKGSRVPSLQGVVNSTLNNANNNVINYTTGNGNLVNQLSNSGNYSLNTGIVLWNDGYITNNIKQKGLLVQSAGLFVQQSQNNITLAITQAYLNILLAKENLKYILDLVNTSTAMVQQGQQLFDAGSIANSNLLQLKAQLAGDRYLLVQTRNTIGQTTLALKQLLQLPTDTLFDIVTPDTLIVAAALPLLPNVQRYAYSTFPDAKIGVLGIDVASLGIAKAKAGFKPVLTASGALGSSYYDVLTNASASKVGYLAQSGNNFYQQAGVSLVVPIFSNRINQTNLAKAVISYKQAQLNAQNYQLVLSQAVELSYLNAANAQEAFVSANEQLVALTETYRITNESFRLGAITSFEVLLQRNLYVQAVQAYTQSKYTAVLQQKIYAFYMGNQIVL